MPEGIAVACQHGRQHVLPEVHQPGAVRDRPYFAAAIGVVVLQLIAIVPVVGIITAVASLFGFGAVLLLAWRTLTFRPSVNQMSVGPTPAPAAG